MWTQKSKSYILAPRTNSRTCWPKVILHVMSGAIFFDCWKSWISRCFLAAFFFRTEAECHVQESSEHQDRRRSCGSKTDADELGFKKLPEREENLFSRFGCFKQLGESKKWIRVPSQGAPGDRCETAAKTQQRILKSGKKMIIRFETTGILCEMVIVQEDKGNWCEVSITSLKGQGWNTTISQSPTIDTLTKYSRTFDSSWMHLSEDTQVFDFEANVLICGLFLSTTIKASVHFGPNYNQNLEGYRNINFEELKNLFDITQWVDSSIMDEMYAYAQSGNRVDWSKRSRLHIFRLMFGQDAGTFRSEHKMECSTPRISTVQLILRIIWNPWRTDWVRSEYFPRSYITGNLPKDPKESARSKDWSRQFGRSNHLVNVESHRLDEERQCRKCVFRIPN